MGLISLSLSVSAWAAPYRATLPSEPPLVVDPSIKHSSLIQCLWHVEALAEQAYLRNRLLFDDSIMQADAPVGPSYRPVLFRRF